MRKLYLLFCVAFITCMATAQKFDTLYMATTEVKVGNIKSIDDNSIGFVHKNESLLYTIKKTDVSKIVFSSGRTENVASNNMKENNSIITSEQEHHNRVAVLPFVYIAPNQQTNVDMGYRVQDQCYTVLSNKAAAFKVQDPTTTNVLLGKSGINADNIRNFTNTELCNVLGVEYIVRGTITTNATSNTSSGSASYDAKNTDGTGKNANSSKTSGSVYTSSSSQQNYQTSVLMEIYSDNGDKVFGKDRTSFWQTLDAYKATTEYLLKKSPVYGR